MKIKINKNIPTPKKLGDGVQYPWDKMNVGDNFYLETPPKKVYQSHQSSVLTSARTWANYNNKKAKFTTRKERKGFRIWRVK